LRTPNSNAILSRRRWNPPPDCSPLNCVELEPPISGQLSELSGLLAPAGRLLLALSLPSKAPRLSSLLAADLLDEPTKQAFLEAEEEIYQPLQKKDGTLTKQALDERLQSGYSVAVCSAKPYTTRTATFGEPNSRMA